MAQKLEAYFAKYKPKKQELAQAPKMLSYKVDNNKKTLVINADGTFAAQEFSEETTADIYKRVRKAIPKPYRKYAITIITNGMAIEDLVPHRIIRKPGKINLWGDIDYDGKPWVSNASSPIEPTHGLQNRHISLWASHTLTPTRANGNGNAPNCSERPKTCLPPPSSYLTSYRCSRTPAPLCLRHANATCRSMRSL